MFPVLTGNICKKVRILEETKEKELRESFLTSLGQKIRNKRERVSLSQMELSEGLHISHNTLSLYEQGKSDIPASLLPLISTYCDFSMADYYDSDIDRMVATFTELVDITRRKYQRRDERQRIKGNGSSRANKRKLKGYIYELDGKEIIRYVSEQKEDSLRQQYLQGDVQLPDTPFTDDEFREYFKNEFKEMDLLYINAATQLLDFLRGEERKETFKGTIAEFVILEMIVKRVMIDSREIYRKAYGYYQKLLEKNPGNQS